MSVANSIFIRKVKKNKRYLRLLKMKDSGLFALDTKADIKKIEDMHATRKMRTLNVKDVLQNFQHNTIEISYQNAGFRSNISSIKFKYYKIAHSLDKHINALSDYIASKYASQLSSEFKTVGAREKALNYILEDFKTILHDFRLVISLADFIIEDLDKAGWSINATIEVMKLTAKDR